MKNAIRMPQADDADNQDRPAGVYDPIAMSCLSLSNNTNCFIRWASWQIVL
ncbi:MAG: hypothetical protein GY786_05110 [Proteobacteria bacterium]|nr:hypothetical protein [Pseudomonadota bacterium]